MEGIIYQYDDIKTINLNEYDLIVKSINSDYDSFANLMKLHKRHLYQMAYIHTRDKDMALDIIQETTIVAFKNIKSLKEPLAFKKWITRILVNITISELKKRKKVIHIDNYDVINNDDIFINNKSINIDEKLDLYNAVDLLKNNYKTIIIMKYFNDLTIKEIGYTLNLSENTVKTNLKRAKEALFKILKEGYLND